MRWIQQLAMRAFIAAHGALYALSDGRIGGRMGNLRILLLTTTGRRSGRARTVPLVFFEDGERLVVIASKGGAPRDPLWWENLQKHPEAVVQIGGEKRAMRARLASPEERARLWPRIKRENPAYAEYEKRTAREIPVVLLCA
ncbi:MAG TPA: nitroreductase family deazaflavin-dependent oxidoreductase [Myxococcota bacterium]|nr:nitroreductase family deazaflavin-dependent oxidoreductase [Myxococcota bacterium]